MCYLLVGDSNKYNQLIVNMLNIKCCIIAKQQEPFKNFFSFESQFFSLKR